ncbi:MAG: NADH-quinone oxidoreductase subunit NuoB [Chloroflexi bacterium]|nr:NADH-quinone oxidoreductase subunit NuoB [Chloroflexota bacterium]
MWDMIRKIRQVGILTEPLPPFPAEYTQQDPQVELVGGELQQRTRILLGRSLHIRQVDAGSDNAAELEIIALGNPYYDMERFGLHIVASPRHADCLMVTGPVTRNMALPLLRTYEATPDPKIVVAVGDAARDGGIFRGSYAIIGGVDQVVPVDLYIPGDPPTPLELLTGMLIALDRYRGKSSRRE